MLAAMTCPHCGSMAHQPVKPKCDACVAHWVGVQRPFAEGAGRVWGHVAINWAIDRWDRDPAGAAHARAAAPPGSVFESPRAQAIAHAQTDLVAGSDIRVRDELARICHQVAGEVYETWRSGGWPCSAGDGTVLALRSPMRTLAPARPPAGARRRA